MNTDDGNALLQAYEDRHGESIGGFIVWKCGERYRHMVLIAEHFLHGKSISDAARTVGISPQGASRVCGQFRYQAIIFCQTVKRDPETFFIPLLRMATDELARMVDWYTALQVRGQVESKPAELPADSTDATNVRPAKAKKVR